MHDTPACTHLQLDDRHVGLPHSLQLLHLRPLLKDVLKAKCFTAKKVLISEHKLGAHT